MQYFQEKTWNNTRKVSKIIQLKILRNNKTLSSLRQKKYLIIRNKNKAFGRPVIFAGGAWTWKGFAPDNRFSIDTIEPALRACRDNEIDDVFITMWGDDGGECSRFSVLPTLCYVSEIFNGARSIDNAKKKLKEITNIEFDDFMLLDKLDNPTEKLYYNASKYLLYNDPFMGTYDCQIITGVNEYYNMIRKDLSNVPVNNCFALIFSSALALADVLSVKSELGIKTRSAYLSGNIAELKKIAVEDYTSVIEKLQVFHYVFEEFWFWENKPHGFDVQDIRLGGIIMRIKSCQRRLLEYCDNQSKIILELSEPVLNDDRSKTWEKIVTANVI